MIWIAEPSESGCGAARPTLPAVRTPTIGATWYSLIAAASSSAADEVSRSTITTNGKRGIAGRPGATIGSCWPFRSTATPTGRASMKFVATRAIASSDPPGLPAQVDDPGPRATVPALGQELLDLLRHALAEAADAQDAEHAAPHRALDAAAHRPGARVIRMSTGGLSATDHREDDARALGAADAVDDLGQAAPARRVAVDGHDLIAGLDAGRRGRAVAEDLGDVRRLLRVRPGDANADAR